MEEISIINKYKDLLNEFGFKVIEYQESDSFGDFFAVLNSNDSNFRIKIVRDRYYESIDIATKSDPEIWFYLTFVMALTLDKRILKQIVTVDEQFKFLKDVYDRINQLYSLSEYPSTKKKLYELMSSL